MLRMFSFSTVFVGMPGGAGGGCLGLKQEDCTTYLKALNNHCSQGMLERHWKKEYDADVKRTEQVVRLRNANSQKGAASQEGAAERRLTDAPPGQGQRDSES